MRKGNVLLLAIAVALAVPVIAQAAGGGAHSGTSTASSTSLVSVTIPGVVAIDIESDMAIDLSQYTTGGVAGGACGSFFPPAPGCTGAATYPATGNTTTAGAPNPPATTANEMWMAVFCNKSAGTLTISAYADAAWGTQAPFGGSTPQDLQFMAAAADNASKVGGTTYAAFGTSGTPALLTNTSALGATFTWTRVDQAIQFNVPSAAGVTFNTGTSTATVTYTISKA